MARPSLTLGIPFHSGVDYLRLAVESVLAQDDSAWRLMVVDDAQPASTAVQDYVESLGDERVTYLRNPQPAGMVANWNFVLDQADSDLVSLLHQDDLLLPNYVSLMRGLAEEHSGVGAFFAEAEIIDAAGARCFSMADWIKRFLKPRSSGLVEVRGEPGTEAVLRGNFIMCPTLCFRRGVLGSRRFDARWQQVQDLDLICRLLLEGETLLGSPELAYAYRRHGQAATSLQSESLLRFREERDLLDQLARSCAERGWGRASSIARKKRIVRLHLAYRILADVLTLRWSAARSKLGFLWSLRAGSKSG